MSLDRRRARLRERLGEAAEAVLVTDLVNVRYLTGFTGSNGQLVLSEEPIFLTDGRYREQSASEVTDVDRRIYAQGVKLHDAVRDVIAAQGIRRLGFEASQVTVEGHRRLAEALEGTELIETTSLVEAVRACKDSDEVDAIRRAQRIAESALREVLSAWDGGTELELALRLEWAVRTGGAEDVSFPTIVASGPHAALPHAQPRAVEVPEDAVLLIDMGARLDGYCSDMTRTFLRDGPEELAEAHAAVVRALEAGIDAARPGTACADVDAAARDVLTEAGYGDAFVHSTGHGVGLDIHEGPRLAQATDEVLEAGMVVTIEPGVYLPGVGGIRVEDLVHVSEDGPEVLTDLPRGGDRPA